MEEVDQFNVQKALARTEFSTLVSEGRKWCYSSVESGELHLVVVVEDCPNYFPLDYDMPHIFANYLAGEKNREMGVTPEEAARIVVSSMRAASKHGKL